MRIVLPLVLLMAACGGVSLDDVVPPGIDWPAPPVGPAPWSIDNPPTIDLPRDVQVVTDVALGLTIDDSVRWGAENGDWEHELSGRVLRVWSTFRPDRLDRITASIDIDFSAEHPLVTGGAITYMNSRNEPATQFVERGTLELQSADLSGVVAGQWIGPYGDELAFWVDLSESPAWAEES